MPRPIRIVLALRAKDDLRPGLAPLRNPVAGKFRMAIRGALGYHAPTVSGRRDWRREKRRGFGLRYALLWVVIDKLGGMRNQVAETGFCLQGKSFSFYAKRHWHLGASFAQHAVFAGFNNCSQDAATMT